MAEKSEKGLEIRDGDFVQLEFTGKDVAGNVFETTSAEIAQSSGIFNQRIKYGPVLVVAGKKMILAGLDDELLKSKVGEERVVKVSPEKAFGLRDQNLISLIPLHEFKKHGITPQLGMPVELDGKRAIVRSISSGRVRVDFNHPLAGEELEYHFKVSKKIDGIEKKVDAVVQDFLGLSNVSKVRDGSVAVEIDEKVAKDSNYFLKKSQLIAFLFAYLDEVKRVEVKEVFVK